MRTVQIYLDLSNLFYVYASNDTKVQNVMSHTKFKLFFNTLVQV